MTKITVFKKDYVTELVKIIRNAKNAQVLQKHLANYHDKDVAEAITRLNETERMQLYTMIGTPRLAEIFSYLDDAKPYLDELSLDKAARVISDMDADAAAGEQYYNPKTEFQSYFLSFEDGARLEIMQKPRVSNVRKELARTGYIHLAFSVGSREKVDALTKRLEEDGYKVVSGPRVTGDGYYESCVLGIEDNQIEITV